MFEELTNMTETMKILIEDRQKREKKYPEAWQRNDAELERCMQDIHVWAQPENQMQHWGE